MKLVDILNSELIECSLMKSEKTDTLRQLINLFDRKSIVCFPDQVLKAVLDREKIMTTGVGNGVAIPHCRTSVAENFALAIGIHSAGVDFQSLDNKPAHLIFLLIGPENQPGTHIRLLSRISRIISRKTLRDQLLNCHHSSEVYLLLKEAEEEVFELNT